jgi:hypothetical protein
MITQPEALRLAAQLDDPMNAKLYLAPYIADELRCLHAETQTLRAALDAAVAWAAPMADAPKSSRPEWFDQARAALSHKGPIQ